MGQAALEHAVRAVDRELAGALELTTLFDQTRQAVVFENAEFLRFRDVLVRELEPAAYAALDHLYATLPDAESAMERRGPANTLKDADRLIVETWEGDARAMQRLLRAATLPPPIMPATGPRRRSRFARLGAGLGRLLRRR